MIPPEVKARTLQIVKDCVAKAEKHFGRTYQIPEVQYNVRGRRGGYASGAALVNFNPILFMENQEEYFTQVVPHEVAHCIDTANGDNQRTSWGVLGGRRSKRSVHGPSWQHIMRLFGCAPDRTHCMDTTNAAVRTKTKFEYQCVTCKTSVFVSSVRHNKQRHHAMLYPGQSFYSCRCCGRTRGELKFIACRGQVSFEQARRISSEQKEQKVSVRFTFDHIPPHVLPPALKENVGLSNVDRARKIYNLYNHLGRQDCIRKMVEIGLKVTTASTYYQNFHRGK